MITTIGRVKHDDRDVEQQGKSHEVVRRSLVLVEILERSKVTTNQPSATPGAGGKCQRENDRVS